MGCVLQARVLPLEWPDCFPWSTRLVRGSGAVSQNPLHGEVRELNCGNAAEDSGDGFRPVPPALHAALALGSAEGWGGSNSVVSSRRAMGV